MYTTWLNRTADETKSIENGLGICLLWINASVKLNVDAVSVCLVSVMCTLLDTDFQA